MFTNHLYGPDSTHRDNRTPFLDWILKKCNASLQVHGTGHFDSWEIIDENTAIKTCDKSFFEHNGSGVPKDICWFFQAEDIPSGESVQVAIRYDGSDYTAKVRNDSTDRRRIQILWTSDLGKQFGRYAGTKEPRARFSKIGDMLYEVSFESGGEEELTVKDTISRIKDYIEAKGFSYQDGLIENFYWDFENYIYITADKGRKI